MNHESRQASAYTPSRSVPRRPSCASVLSVGLVLLGCWSCASTQPVPAQAPEAVNPAASTAAAQPPPPVQPETPLPPLSEGVPAVPSSCAVYTAHPSGPCEADTLSQLDAA